MTTSADERRTAIRLARKLLDTPGVADDVKLLCSVLADCQEAFVNRLAPVYHAACQLVRDDGTTDATKWAGFLALVQKCRAHDHSQEVG